MVSQALTIKCVVDVIFGVKDVQTESTNYSNLNSSYPKSNRLYH